MAGTFVGDLDNHKQGGNMRRYVSLVVLALLAALVFAPAATAQMNDDQMMDDDQMMSTSTSTASSTSTATSMSTASAMNGETMTASAMGDEMMTASATATAMMGDKLPGTGGPSLVPAFALMAGLVLMGSGVAAFAFVRRAFS